MKSLSFAAAIDLTSGLNRAASRFKRAPRELLKERRLLRRVDTKFLLPVRLVSCVLSRIASDYLLVPSPCAYYAKYRTIYFDTPSLRCFHDDRKPLQTQQSLRIRQYLEADDAYFELKTKLSGGQTVKHRVQQVLSNENLTGAARQLVRNRTQLPVHAFQPSIAVSYQRLSLLNQHSPERVTLDLHIRFDGEVAGRDLQDIAILEVKQENLAHHTPIMQALGALGIQRIDASKYCTTIALRDPSLPRDHVEPVIHAIRRIQEHAGVGLCKCGRSCSGDGTARASILTQTRPHDDPV